MQLAWYGFARRIDTPPRPHSAILSLGCSSSGELRFAALQPFWLVDRGLIVPLESADGYLNRAAGVGKGRAPRSSIPFPV